MMAFNGPYSPGKWPEGSFFEEMEKLSNADIWKKVYGDFTNYKRKSRRFAKQVSNGMELTAMVMSANFSKRSESPIKRVREFLKHLLRYLCHNEGALFPVQWDFTERNDFCEHPPATSTGVGNHQFMSAYTVVITFEYHQFDVLEATIAEKKIERFEFEEQVLSNVASNFPAHRFEVAKKRFQHAHDFFKLLIEKCIDMLYGFGVQWKLRDEEKHRQDLLNFEKKNVLRVAEGCNVDFSVVKRALTKRSTSEDVDEEPAKKKSAEDAKSSTFFSPFTSNLLKSMRMSENGLQVDYRLSPEPEEVAGPAPAPAPAPTPTPALKVIEQEVIETVRESDAHSGVVEQQEEEDEEDLFPRAVTTTSEPAEHVLKVDINSNEKSEVLTLSPSSMDTPSSSAQSSPTRRSQTISFRLHNQRMDRIRRSQKEKEQKEQEKEPVKEPEPEHKEKEQDEQKEPEHHEQEDEKEREEDIDNHVAFSQQFHANQEHPMFAGRLRHFHLFNGPAKIREMMFGDMVEKWKNEWVLNARMSVMTKAVLKTRRECQIKNNAEEILAPFTSEEPVTFEAVKEFVEKCMSDVFFVNINDEDEAIIPKIFRKFDESVVSDPGNFHPNNVRIQWFRDYDVTKEDGRYLKLNMEELCRYMMADLVRTVLFVREHPETREMQYFYNPHFEIPAISDRV